MRTCVSRACSASISILGTHSRARPRVVVPEALAGGLALHVPCGRVATVEAHHGQIARRGRGDRGQARVEPLRHVDTDVGEVEGLQEAQGLLDVVLTHPRCVAELDGDAEVAQPFGASLDVRLVLAADREPLGELEEHGAELPRGVQRHQGVVEPLPHLVDGLLRQLVPIDEPLVERALGQGLADVRVERVGSRRMVGEERVGLDVERELRRGAFDPQHGVLLRRREVVTGIHLHQREASGVEAEPGFRGLRAGRVEVAVLDQRGIRPGGRADRTRPVISEIPR